MQLILDNLASILIGGVVIIMVLNTQIDAQQAAAEQSTAYAARKATLSTADLLEDEFRLIGDGATNQIDSLAANAAGETAHFGFWRDDGSGDMLVEYRLFETDSVYLANDDRFVQLYRLDRFEDGTHVGGGPSTIRSFRVSLMTETGANATPATTRLVKVALVVTYPFGESRDAYLYQTHWGTTVAPVNLE